MLVDEFLDLTQIEAGQLRLHWSRVRSASSSTSVHMRSRPQPRRHPTALRDSCRSHYVIVVVSGGLVAIEHQHRAATAAHERSVVSAPL